MSLVVVPGQVLAADLVTGGTVAVNYPTGFSKADLEFGLQDRLVTSTGDVYVQGNDFQVANGASSITVTWKRTNTLKAGTSFAYEIDLGGSSYRNEIDRKDGSNKSIPANVALRGLLAVISLGVPATASATSVLNASAATGSSATDIAAATTLDVPRTLQYVSSNVGDTTQTITTKGKDVNGQAMSEAISLNGTTVVHGKKAFASVATYRYSANLAGNLSIGSDTALGLPVAIAATGLVVGEIVDGAKPGTAGTFVSADESTALTTTGDVRGTYVPNTAPNGSHRYQLVIALLDEGYQGTTNA